MMWKTVLQLATSLQLTISLLPESQTIMVDSSPSISSPSPSLSSWYDDINECSLLLMFPFGFDRGIINDFQNDSPYGRNIFTAENLAKDGYSMLASALMAVHHFNTKSAQVIPQLANPQYQSCDITLSFNDTYTVVPSNSDPDNAIQGIWNAINNHDNNKLSSKCNVMLGPIDEEAAKVAGKAANILHFTTIHYGASSPILTFPVEYKNAIRSSFSDQTYLEAFYKYLILHNRKYLHALSGGLDTDANFLEVILQEAFPFSISVQTHRLDRTPETPPKGDHDPLLEHTRVTLQEIKTSGIRTILVATTRKDLVPYVATVADELGMLEPDQDYLWIFSERTIPYQHVSLLTNESKAVNKLLKSAAMFQPVSQGYYHEALFVNENDRFLHAWKLQSSDTVERINQSILPYIRAYPNMMNVSEMPLSYFQDSKPGQRSEVVYDSIIAGGLSACDALTSLRQKQEENKEGCPGTMNPSNSTNGVLQSPPSPEQQGQGKEGPPPLDGPPPGGGPPPGDGPPPLGGTGNAWSFPGHRALRQQSARLLNYHKMDGPGNKEGKWPPPNGPPPKRFDSCDMDEIDFACHHTNALIDLTFDGASGHYKIDPFRSRDKSTVKFGIFNIRFNETSQLLEPILTHVFTGGTWTETENDFIYKSGNTEVGPDRVSRIIYVANSIRIISLLLMSVAISFSIISAVFIWRFRTEHALKVSQPEFLLVLCLGAFIMPLSILADSVDEGLGWSSQQLEFPCKLGPWFLTIGYTTIYMALFCKLWRINQVLQFRRNIKVSVYQVLGPFAIALVSVIAVMTTWAIVSPIHWVREELDIYPPKSIGYCYSQHGVYFIVPLAIILAVITAIAFHMAYKTRDAPDDISDASRVFSTVFTHAEGMAIGVPVILLMRNVSRDMFVLGSSIMVSTICLSSLGFLIVPKMQHVWTTKYSSDARNNGTLNARRRSAVRISGLNPRIVRQMEFDTFGGGDGGGDAPSSSMGFTRRQHDMRFQLPGGASSSNQLCKYCGATKKNQDVTATNIVNEEFKQPINEGSENENSNNNNDNTHKNQSTAQEQTTGLECLDESTRNQVLPLAQDANEKEEKEIRIVEENDDGDDYDTEAVSASLPIQTVVQRQTVISQMSDTSTVMA